MIEFNLNIAIISIVLMIAMFAGVDFGTDNSRPVNLFPGSLIILLAIANLASWYLILTPLTTFCLYFLILLLAILVIYLVEMQRPLAKVSYQIEETFKQWFYRVLKK